MLMDKVGLSNSEDLSNKEEIKDTLDLNEKQAEKQKKGR
jgi:hypothetical protein